MARALGRVRQPCGRLRGEAQLARLAADALHVLLQAACGAAVLRRGWSDGGVDLHRAQAQADYWLAA